MVFSSTTSAGLVKKENQDFCGNLAVSNGHIFNVCDGLSALKNGGLASKIASTSILETFCCIDIDPADQLFAALEIAHSIIIDTNIYPGGTTSAVVFCKNNITYTGWCGDSRIYYFSNDKLQWMSRDHNVLHDILNRGLSRSDVYKNPYAITRYLGNTYNHLADTHMFSTQPGDKILLCTDGLSNFIVEQVLYTTILNNNVSDAGDILEKKLLSKEIGAPDNFTWYIIEL